MRFTVGVFLLLVPLVLGSVSAWAGVGRILSFEGDVQINGQQITSDTVLNLDDTVVTGPDGSVQIVLSDNSVLDLDGDSQININDYSFNATESDENTSQISVLAGTLRYVSGKIAKDDPENVSFTAGTSTIGVRGTYISISICGDEVCD
ncbi:MAG: FecR family protein [Halioglobus sp.]